MSKISQLVTQSGVDTFTAVAIATGIALDGKTGYEVRGLSAFWVDGSAVAAADWSIHAVVSTVATQTTYGSADEIARLSWGAQNTGGVAVALPYEPIKGVAIEPRVTVQPNIYVSIISAATSQANDIIFVVDFDLVKLTDVEVLRLFAGGA